MKSKTPSKSKIPNMTLSPKGPKKIIRKTPTLLAGRNNISNIETKVEAILTKVRPYIQMHGGDVALISVNDGIVTLNVSGACAHCRLADLTYNNLIAGLLKAEIPEIKDILLEK